MTSCSRRRFLEDSILAVAAAAGTPAVAIAVGGAGATHKNRDPLRVGVVGVRGRGRAHIKSFKDAPDAEVVAICDADEGIIGPAMKSVPNAKYYRDIRAMLDDGSIDVVSIATPNHWHALGAVWAMQAGKHVYVEKPISHSVAEGRAVVEAARRYGRIAQHGTQARSHTATRDAIAWLRSGALGECRLARALCYKRRESIGKVDGPQQPPSTCDYDLWTGPAAFGPLLRRELHYDWHWDYSTGNGDIGNQGVHQMDIARWGLGLDGFPRRVTSLGGRLGYDDDGNTANSQIAVYDYGDKEIIFEVRGLPTRPYRGAHIGVIFHCEHGYLVSAAYERLAAFDHDGKEIRVFEGGGDHVRNFLDAVQRNDETVLTAPPMEGHITSALCHLGNISYRLGAPVPLDATPEPFRNDESANFSFVRMREHLIANGLDPKETRYAFGAALEFDEAREVFVGERAPEANAMLAVAGRGPYTFPDLA